MPSEYWKMHNYHQKWFAGETISVGIGQGAVTATPMQLARALSGIASGGVLRRPHVILDGQITPQMRQAINDSYPGSGEKTIPLTPANWETITDGMSAVTSSPIGTAYVAHLDGIDFAGKTGTADVVAGREKNSKNKDTIPNAWFVGMTPRRNPDIVVAVLWQHGYWATTPPNLRRRSSTPTLPSSAGSPGTSGWLTRRLPRRPPRRSLQRRLIHPRILHARRPR